MSRKLFVGGVANGKWIETHDKDFVRIAKKQEKGPLDNFSKLFGNAFDMFDMFATPVEHHAYQIQRWHADGTRFEIFAPVGQPPSDTFQLLIRNYRP